MILVDSSVWIDYFLGEGTPETGRLDGLLENEPLATGDLVLTEVLQGFAGDRDFDRARTLLTSLLVVELGGREIGIRAAQNYRKLRVLGITVRKTINTVIATRCIEDDFAFLYSDRDFHPFVALGAALSDGRRVAHWDASCSVKK